LEFASRDFLSSFLCLGRCCLEVCFCATGWDCRTSNCRSFATISSGLYRFFAIRSSFLLIGFLKGRRLRTPAAERQKNTRPASVIPKPSQLRLDKSMSRSLSHRLFTFVVALSLAALSVVAAERMAPTRADSPEAQALIAAGFDPSDICGLPGKSASLHHCPFCHKLGDPPRLAVALRVERVALGAPWRPTPKDQRLGPQYVNSSVSARAPPKAA
jgi:hypothetical protein